MPQRLSRRSFTQLFCTTIIAASAFAGATAHAAGDLAFVLYADKAGEFRWRLKAANGETLATSGQGYKAKADAKAGISRIKSDAPALSFETYEDAKHEFRFRVKAKNGQVIASSSEGYSERAGADRAAALVKEGARDARVTDDTAK